jgi:hypothetical protein
VTPRGTPEEVAEFAALSAKVSDKQATEEERVRWRELRTRLAGPPPPPSHLKPAPQRAHARVTRKLKLAYVPVKTMTVTFSDEVGGGGLRFIVHDHVDVGTTLVMRLELAGADAEPLATLARVAWVKREGNHYQVGVEFVGLKPEDRERVEAYAHATDPKPADPKPA